MKAAYPVVLTQGESFVVVQIPDFNIGTQGVDFADAMYMARDAIGLMGIDMEDDKEEIPTPTDLRSIKAEEDSIVTLVDVDFAEYRRKHEKRMVKKNCTIPSWLNERAEAEGVNFSNVLQTALKQQLHID
ncbi:MAG: type II toxin-antitoxin system HicB family antitoxin [Bacillota bacterium]|nr:type II toxin-antitoxin system HicB family antitoxin [Bacillota bacterium]